MLVRKAHRNGFVLLLAICLLPMASCSRNPVPSESKNEQPDGPGKDDEDRKRLDKLIAGSTEAIKKNPQEFDSRGELAYHRRGKAYAEKGDDEKAISDLTEAIRLYTIANPPYRHARLIEAYNARAKCHERKKKYDQAIADYSEVIRMGTGGFSDAGEALAFGGFAANAYFKRGVLYDDKGEHEKAIGDYKEAARIAPELLKTNPDLKRRLDEQKP